MTRKSDKVVEETKPRKNAEKPSPEDHQSDLVSLTKQVEEVKSLLLIKRTTEALDLLDLLRSKRRLILANFLIGLFRGIGLFLGMTIVGALLLGIVVFVTSRAESILGLEKGSVEKAYRNIIERGEELRQTNSNNLPNGQNQKQIEEVVRRLMDEQSSNTASDATQPDGSLPEEHVSEKPPSDENKPSPENSQPDQQ